MKTLHISDEFDCSADTYWEKYMLDEGFFEKLNPKIQIKKRELLERKENGPELYRKIRQVPSIEIPGVIQKLIGGDASYIEESWFNRTTKAYRYTIAHAAVGKKLDFQGTVVITPLGEHRCRREMKATVKIDIMFVGGQIESFLGGQIEEGYRAATRLTREEIQKSKVA